MAKGKDGGWFGAIVVLLLLAFIIGALRRGDSLVTSGTQSTTQTDGTVTRTVPLAPVTTAPPLVVATAAPLTSFDWSGLQGVAVDHDVTSSGQYVLQVANRVDDSVRTFVVPKAVFDACPIPSEFDGSRQPPCGG